MASTVRFQEVRNHGDQRGFSFTVPAEALAFLGSVGDVHLSSVLPSTVRGNHYHTIRREVILVNYHTEWSFHWDEGEGCPAQHRQFAGSGAVLVLLEPGASHAVRNDGNGSLVLAAVLSAPYDPNETVARRVI